jgi:hypothetical protein
MMNKTVTRLLSAICCLLLVASLHSCSVTKDTPRNDRRVSSWMMANPGKAGGKCSRMFPPTDSTGTSSHISPGITQVIPSDSAAFNPYEFFAPWLEYIKDSTAKAVFTHLLDSFRTHPIMVPCPPSTHTRDTIFQSDYKRDVDRGKNTQLEEDNKHCSEALIKSQAETGQERKLKNMYLWALIAVGIYTVARWIIKAQWPAIGKWLP